MFLFVVNNWSYERGIKLILYIKTNKNTLAGLYSDVKHFRSGGRALEEKPGRKTCVVYALRFPVRFLNALVASCFWGALPVFCNFFITFPLRQIQSHPMIQIPRRKPEVKKVISNNPKWWKTFMNMCVIGICFKHGIFLPVWKKELISIYVGTYET